MDESEISEFHKSLLERTDSGFTLMGAAILDEALQKLLLTFMPTISNSLALRLFDDYGPLNSFSAKIDISRALGLIDLDTYTDLKAIKAIRNAFAHPKDEWSFNSPEIEKLAKALKAYRPGSNVRELFQKSSANVAAAIGAKADALIYSHAAKPVE
jgi:DNA-binding MltR family transcriptional regulator